MLLNVVLSGFVECKEEGRAAFCNPAKWTMSLWLTSWNLMEGVFWNHPTTIDVPLPALPVPYEHVIHLSLEKATWSEITRAESFGVAQLTFDD
jgi:hypothetical protein